jgi:diguanylate cyclase (GGDEF)-like protein
VKTASQLPKSLKLSSQERYADPYRWLIVAVGAVALSLSAVLLTMPPLDLRFLVLAAVMMVVSSYFSVQIPRVNTNVTVSDTFIFLVLLLYGGLAGIFLAAAEGLCSGLRVSKGLRPYKKVLITAFNSAMMACSTVLTVVVMRYAFGSFTELRSHTPSFFIAAIGVMAMVQYFSNTGLSAILIAIKENKSIWRAWHSHYMWTSLTYLVGAAVAGALASGVERAGMSVLLVTTPIILIVYFTYQKYLNEIRTTSAQAEQAERERAEQAELHIEELRRHIAEQERIGRELEESREHFRHVAFHDTLTDLPNRALLTSHLQLSIDRAKLNSDHRFALLFLDLDRFKNINDSLGHVAGDQLLTAVARRLEEGLRPMDTVARLGGDEFAILLDGVEDYDDVILVAERAQRELMRPLNLNGHEVYTTASIGVTLNTIKYNNPESILRDADTAMYHAKEKGKARYEIFDAVMHERAVSRLQIENDLRRAIERQELTVYYQPIISLDTNKIAGFEALVRWNHPEKGLVSPVDFISVAEETGLIVELGRWVLEQSCYQMRAWQMQDHSPTPLTISVNLSGKQFLQNNLIEQIQQTLVETELDPRTLKLEITESVVMENAELAGSMLSQLRGLGVQLSIDDFGTGYSSLSYLHRFPVNTLKIDRSFINRMGSGDENTEIVRTIITLAGNLGMDVIAEGVETAKHLAHLKKMKCKFGQGYLFSKPVNAQAAGELLQAERIQLAHTYAQLKHQEVADVPGSSLVM